MVKKAPRAVDDGVLIILYFTKYESFLYRKEKLLYTMGVTGRNLKSVMIYSGVEVVVLST